MKFKFAFKNLQLLLLATSFVFFVSCGRNMLKGDAYASSSSKYTYTGSGNPYLPLWEHLPDGEPRVFEDPDIPGKFRVYIIGSHD
ncbi:MAG: hypothetical protein GX921_00635, partial [Bacteroidales bacterium]|nr:hypothetical protein [Bacteroidales bacterium]